MYYITYGFLYLVSLMPFWILYAMSDLLYILIYYIIGYRKKVVINNLMIAFPEKSQAEIIKIAKEFYHNFLDNFFETIKLLSISKEHLLKKCTGNFDFINLLTQKKNVQFHVSHQFNWEYGNCIYPQKLTVPFVGVYMPLTNKVFDKLFLKIRTRFNTVTVDATRFTRHMVGISKKPHVLALICDQNPGKMHKAIWLDFFSKPAPFLDSPEKGALRNNTAVIFTRIEKIKRGNYYYENTLITENAAECIPGDLTKKYRDFLQTSISRQPSNYLWSHKRWKHQYIAENKIQKSSG